MIEYIKEIIDTMRLCKDGREGVFGPNWGNTKPDYPRLLEALTEELQRLDPRDFEPKARLEFVSHRATIRVSARPGVTTRDYDDNFRYVAKIKDLLDSFRGEGSGAQSRDFSFVSNPDIRAIIERDYRELDERTFRDGSWKSSVILAGSILEAVLYDLLTKDQATKLKAMASNQAPRRNNGRAVRDISKHNRADEWTLNDLIKVACDLGLIRQEDERTIHGVLRDFRNFVHPRVELATGIKISEAQANTSKGMLDIILDYLTP